MTLKTDIEGNVAVVTGAGSGIGRAIALGLAAEGARVAIADIDREASGRVATEIESAGGKAFEIIVDVADRQSCIDAAETLHGVAGDAAILVNNAAIVRLGDVAQDGFLDVIHESLRVNLDGCVNMVTALLPQLRRTRGRIINIASTAGLLPSASTPYSLSKSTVVSLTRSLAMDLGRDGIRVNAVAPGVVLGTAITAGLKAEDPILDRFLSRCPMGEPCTPEDIVGPVLFFAGGMSRNVTGTVLPVDGGYLTTGIPGRF